MNRPPFEVADIIRAHGNSFVERNRSWLTWVYLGVNYTALGRTADAIEALEKRPELSTWHRGGSAFLAWNYKLAGETVKAQLPVDRFGTDSVFTLWLSVLSGDFDAAAECLKQLIAARSPGAILLNCLPIASNFRRSLQARELFRKIGLAEE
jgi:tetratricopeptide (TPR) repeat protein